MTRSARKTPGEAAASRRSPPMKKAKAACMDRSREQEEEEPERKIWMDPDARSIDCGICFMPFEAEVFMCSNGHAACAKCCVRINRKCWCCAEPIGDVRCRPAEKMLAEMNTVCKFGKYGCAEVVKFVNKRKHEETCPRAPSGCPVEACGYLGLDLHAHLEADHGHVCVPFVGATTTVALCKGEPFRILVQERAAEDARSVFLLLNGGGVLAGRSLSLVRLGPRPEGDGEISYSMEVRGCQPGALSLAATAPCVRLLEGFEATKFLFVPDADWGPSGSISVSIRVG